MNTLQFLVLMCAIATVVNAYTSVKDAKKVADCQANCPVDPDGGWANDDGYDNVNCKMNCVESAGATDIVSSSVAIIVAFAAAMFN